MFWSNKINSRNNLLKTIEKCKLEKTDSLAYLILRLKIKYIKLFKII